jgi:hypothetical protein
MALTKGTNSGTIALGGSFTIATKTISPSVANSRIWAGGFAVIELVDATSNTPELSLLIDGSVVDTANFATGVNDTDAVVNYSAVVSGAAAEGSGSKVCLLRVVNRASGSSASAEYDVIGGIVCGAMKAST